MLTKIKTYTQARPKEWLKDHPDDRWRCDIFPDDGSDHHGVGATEAEALHKASLAYLQWAKRYESEQEPTTPKNRDQDYCRICGGWIEPGDSYRADADHIWHTACEAQRQPSAPEAS